MTDTYELRAPGCDIFTNARAGSFTLPVDIDALGSVGTADDWSAAVVATDYDAMDETLITPTIVIDTFANSATFSWTDADAETLMGAGVKKTTRYYTFRHDDGELTYEVKGKFVMDRSAVASGSSAAATLTIENQTLTLTGAVSVSAAALTGPRRPLPLGSRFIPFGHSIVIGTGASLSSTSANNGDSRQQVGSWPSRLAGQYPDRYLKIRNAGVGGDIVGGQAELTTAAEAGDTTLTVTMRYGCRPYNTLAGIYIGGYGAVGGETATFVSAVAGTDTYTITLSSGIASDWPVGTEVSWGMHARLQASVLDWDPEMVLLLCLTNDSDTGAGKLTAEEAVAGAMDLGSRIRDGGAEPVFLEELPRSTNSTQIADINDELAYQCRVYSYHLVPLYHLFANGSGDWADTLNQYDGLHPSDLGHQRIANAVHRYLAGIPMRVSATRLASMDTETNNLISHACMLTSSGGVPTGWTGTPFFATNTTPSVVAPASTDNIVGQWAQIAATTGAAGNYTLSQTVPAQTVGDLIYLACRVRTTGFAGGCTATIQFVTGSFNIDLGYLIADDCDFTLVATTSTLTSTTLHDFRVQLTPNGGSGTVMFAQPLMLNLTDLGRDA